MGSKSKAPGHKSHVKRKRSASHTPDKGTYVQREHKDRLSGLYSGTGRNCFNYIMRLTNRIMTMRQSLLSRHWKTYSIWAIKMMWRFCWNRFCSWGEHQSSWNPNMPLRGLLYFSSMYQDYVTGKNRKLMESCRPLHDYSLFVHRIREKLAEGYRPDDRMEDFWKAVEDEKLCRRLLEEYDINTTL